MSPVQFRSAAPIAPGAMLESSLTRDLVRNDDLALLDCSEMAQADAAAMLGGVSGPELMEAAGKAVADAVLDRFPLQPVVVLCGPGNNGGDGFVAARHLAAAGWPVQIALLGELEALRGDAAWAASLWTGAIRRTSLDLLAGRPVVIDALFGAGLARPIGGIAATLIDHINA